MAVFGKSPDEKRQRIMADMIRRVNDNVRRLRVIEQKIQAIDTRINSIEQNFVSYNKNIQKSLSDRDLRISNLEDRILKIETTSKEILKQLKLVATKTNVEEIKQLISIYDPLKSKFVTKEEMERFVGERMSKV
jgi:DNA repair exonuclease SbcCD ATPase subunit